MHRWIVKTGEIRADFRRHPFDKDAWDAPFGNIGLEKSVLSGIEVKSIKI